MQALNIKLLPRTGGNYLKIMLIYFSIGLYQNVELVLAYFEYLQYIHQNVNLKKLI